MRARGFGIGLLGMLLVLASGLMAGRAVAQGVSTTTVQGTVYRADGTTASGTLLLSWPAFTTAAVGTGSSYVAGQEIAAGNLTVAIGADGFLTVNLTPNAGALPAGLYYTAVYQLSDGTVNTEYWVVPAAATATIASVQAQVMPAAQAVQSVSKAYVDEAIANLEGSLLTTSGGTLTGPLILAGDPTTPLMAADKHYVDESVAGGVGGTGGAFAGVVTAPAVNGVYAPAPGTTQTTLQATQTAAAGAGGAMMVPPTYTGTDGFTNAAGIRVEDMRASGAQQHERNVKEFGAVCDGVTDDTVALQAAINFAQSQAASGHFITIMLPAGICKTQQLQWHLESIGGQGVQASGLMGFPGQDVLATATDAGNLLSHTRVHDLTIYVDQSLDVSCSPAEGREAAGSCGVNRAVEGGTIFSPGGNGLTGTLGTGAGWSVGNCAIATSAVTGAGGNGLKQAVIENVAIATTGVDPLGQYAQAHSTHTCGMWLGQWPVGTAFRNVHIAGVGTGIALPALAGAPAGLVADGNRWENLTVQAVHGLVVEAGSNGVVDGLTLSPVNSAATGEAPTGVVLDGYPGGAAVQTGWTVRNAVVAPQWVAVQPALTVHAAGGAVGSVGVGPEHGLGFEAYGVSVPLTFSGSCTAQASAGVNGDGSLSNVTVTAGGIGCSGTTTATVNVAGTSMPGRAVNLVAGRSLTMLGGNLLAGVGGYTVWNAGGSRTLGTQMGGGGTLVASTTAYPALVVSGSANRFEGAGLNSGGLSDAGLGNAVTQASVTGAGTVGLEAARAAGKTVSADFVALGGGSANQAFTSLNDLFFSAEDLYAPAALGGESVGTGSLFGKDAAAPVTGSYVKAVGGAWDSSGAWALRGVAGSLVLGQGFPAGSGTWFVAAKADVATTQELRLTGVGALAGCVYADQTVSLATSWQVFKIGYNTVTGNGSCDSATQGTAVSAAGLAPSVSTNVETAFEAFVPAAQGLLLAGAPTAANQAANKGYVDAAVAGQIVSGGGVLPITGGTLTGPLMGPAIDGTVNCGDASSVSGCVATAGGNAGASGGSVLIPPGTVGSFAQGAALQATAQCVYDVATGGGITSIVPGALGLGYATSPAVTVNAGTSGGNGLAVTANVSGGQVTSYTIANPGAGYGSCPTISVAVPPASSVPVPVLDQRRGVTSYSAEVRVDDFGCAADGVTDDTNCFNEAINYVTAGGTRSGALSLTQGKTYFIGTITGYMQTAWDDGTAPSTDTCGGVACTNLAPETPGYLGYAVKISSGQATPLTIYGNGATIISSYGPGQATVASYPLAAPYFAVFGSDTSIGAWNLYDLNINRAFIAAATKSAGYWRWERVSMNTVGVVALLGSSQYDQFKDLFVQNASSGIVVGGWWGTRAPYTSASGGVYINDEDLGDATSLDGMVFYGASWGSQAQSQMVQNALDTWFNTNFFHVTDNQTRMTDQNQAGLGLITDSMWRGIYHVMFAVYSRYNRPVLGVSVTNANVKATQNYPIVATAATGWTINGLGMEDVGFCNGNPTYGSFGSTGCPSPYDSVNNQLPGAILMSGFAGIGISNVGGSGAVLETIAEPPQISAAQQLADFRANVTNLSGGQTSPVTPRTAPVRTGRMILAPSSLTGPPGTTNFDSAEFCLKGVNVGFADEWCTRAVEGTYASGGTMPRYLAMENDGYAAFTGTTAVQMPGLRVRPGLISASDTTLPVTDFAEQAFAIAGGTVLGQTCATVPGIVLGNAAATDGVLFVKAPAATGQLLLSGSVTGAGTLAMTACNPSTQAQSYPAGTYYAFLLAGAAAPSSPTVSGGTAVGTNPLTSSEGDLVVGDLNGNPSRLGGNTTTTAAVLTQTGTGSGANEPVWSTAPNFYGGNLTGLSASNLTTGTVGVGNGGTGASTAVQALANLGGASLLAPLQSFAGELTAKQLGGAYQVDQFAGADLGAQLSACLSGLSSAYGGVCDARNFTGTVTMASTLTIGIANTTVLLPCATISTGSPIVVPAGVRNVTLHGCGLRGASTASGSQGGTVLLYTGTGGAVEVGDPTYAADTLGFHLDNVVINTTGSASATTSGLAAWRVQEMDLESLYFLGNSNQTGLLVDGTGNYAGGTFYDLAFNGFQAAVNGIGHQVANPATTDWMNASTFVRVHIDCPTSGGSPIAGTYGINLQQGDGNTFTGGDVEGCATALHLGANAQNNTLVGLRNENSTSQVVADAGSSYNSWVTGGTMFTGALTDNGTRNSFLDTFHRAFNGLKGDWYQSQFDGTVTNHLRLGTGAGNERGMLNRYQTDYGYRWTMGLSDATAGEQFYQVLDELNSVYRLSIGQYNNGASSTNNQTVVNAAGTGAVVLNGSNNSGSGGVVFGSGGATETTVATVDGSGNANFLGTLQVGGVTTHIGSVTVKNQADAEIDSTLWAGLTTSQKESFIYKDWNGNSQWYMVKDQGNNWALNSAVDATDHFKAYQNGETMLNSHGTGYVSVNREASSGTGGLVVFSGGSSPVQVAAVDSAGDLTNAGTHVSAGNVSVVNGSNAEADFIVQPGATVDENGAFQLNSYGGVAQWKLKKDGSNYFRLSDVVNGMDRVVLFQNGNTNLNAGSGANAVVVNSAANSGTGGLLVYSGGATPAQVAKIDGSGNLTVASCTGCAGGGTVNSAAGGLVAYYATTGTALSGLAVTGTGNAVLATSPTLATPTLTSPTMSGPTVTGTLTAAAATLSGNVTLKNATNAAQTLAIQPGSSAEQNGILQFVSYAGTSEWTWKKDASNYLRLSDGVNSLDREIYYQNGQTAINSGAGANAVVVNNTSGSGTGGLTVYEGGTNNTVSAWQVSGAGATSQAGTMTAPSATVNGWIAARMHVGSGTMTLAVGSAAGTGGTLVCATSHVCDGVSGALTLTTGTGPATGTVGTLTFPYAHTNQANCVVGVETSTGLVSSVVWSESTTAVTLTAGVALTASTAYSVRYWCGGN